VYHTPSKKKENTHIDQLYSDLVVGFWNQTFARRKFPAIPQPSASLLSMSQQKLLYYSWEGIASFFSKKGAKLFFFFIISYSTIV